MQAHTPKPDKMPPIGNFAPPSSVSKDSKKRRGGAGTQITVGGSSSNAPDTSAARTSTIQGGNVSKVSPKCKYP